MRADTSTLHYVHDCSKLLPEDIYAGLLSRSMDRLELLHEAWFERRHDMAA